MSRTRVTLLLTGLFLLGVVCGAFGMAAYGRHHRHEGFSPERMERFVIRRLSRRLSLDDAQRKVLEETTHRARAKLDQVRSETLPRIEAILDEACTELKPALRPDQQKELDKVRAEAEDRLRRHIENAGSGTGARGADEKQ